MPQLLQAEIDPGDSFGRYKSALFCLLQTGQGRITGSIMFQLENPDTMKSDVDVLCGDDCGEGKENVQFRGLQDL